MRVIASIEEQEAYRNQQAEKPTGTILDSKKKGLADLPLTHLNSGFFGMPRHRIELWTRGFSVRCSTD
jgi:hypothetical protein